MATINISLSEALMAFVDERAESQGLGTGGEYVKGLIRKDQARVRLRRVLLDGAGSLPGAGADGRYFDGLRKRVLSRR